MIAMIPPNRPKLIWSSAAVCLACCVLLGCVTRVERLPPDLGPRPVVLLERWDVEVNGQPVGRMTLLRVEDEVSPQTLYKVEHADGQHAGWIDVQGRAWREEPFREGLVLVTMDTMAEDLRVLLELGRQPELRAREATWRRGPVAN